MTEQRTLEYLNGKKNKWSLTTDIYFTLLHSLHNVSKCCFTVYIIKVQREKNLSTPVYIYNFSEFKVVLL